MKKCVGNIPHNWEWSYNDYLENQASHITVCILQLEMFQGLKADVILKYTHSMNI